MRTWSLRLLRQLFRLTLSGLHVVAAATSAAFKSRAALQLENLAVRHQLGVLRRSVKRPKLTSADRFHMDLAVRSLERLAIRLIDIQQSDMPNVMSKMMLLGMSFPEVLVRSTVNPPGRSSGIRSWDAGRGAGCGHCGARGTGRRVWRSRIRGPPSG